MYDKITSSNLEKTVRVWPIGRPFEAAGQQYYGRVQFDIVPGVDAGLADEQAARAIGRAAAALTCHLHDVHIVPNVVYDGPAITAGVAQLNSVPGKSVGPARTVPDLRPAIELAICALARENPMVFEHYDHDPRPM